MPYFGYIFVFSNPFNQRLSPLKPVINMAERKSKRAESFVEFDPGEAGFVMETAKVELGAGYALSVQYDENEKPIIDVKTYGKVDFCKIQKEINRLFPHAHIRQLNQTQPVTIVKKEKRRRNK
jgi:hypothetical protein